MTQPPTREGGTRRDVGMVHYQSKPEHGPEDERRDCTERRDGEKHTYTRRRMIRRARGRTGGRVRRRNEHDDEADDEGHRENAHRNDKTATDNPRCKASARLAGAIRVMMMRRERR